MNWELDEDDWSTLYYLMTRRGKLYGPCLQKRDLAAIYGLPHNSFVIKVTPRKNSQWTWAKRDVPYYNGNNAVDKTQEYRSRLK